MSIISSKRYSEMSVLYALPSPRFFSQFGGIGGHVAHAFGVARAFSEKGLSLDFFAEELPSQSMDFVRSSHIYHCPRTSPLFRFFWNRNFIKEISTQALQQNYSFCYIRYSTQFSPLVPTLKKNLGSIPLILELNSFGSQQGFPQSTFLSKLESQAIISSDLTVCISQVLLNEVKNLLGDKAAEKCCVIPNAVDPNRFPSVSIMEKSEKTPLNICYCGVIKTGYGLELLLEAHRELEKEYQGIKLHIIGEGPHRPCLENDPRRGNNVIFHGPIPFDQIPHLLTEMDILIHTTSEGNSFQSPIKLYEYMSTGRPIVAADTPQNRQVLAGPPPLGQLFRVGDLSSLTDRINALLKNPANGQTLAEEARRKVREEHNWTQRIELLLTELQTRGILSETS